MLIIRLTPEGSGPHRMSRAGMLEDGAHPLREKAGLDVDYQADA